MREAHVPAQQPQAEEDPRLPQPDEQSRRSRRAQIAARPRPQASVDLIWRVRDRAMFAALSRARRVRRSPITLRYLPVGEADPPRVAYAIGRATGTAVVRNRVRRRLQAVVSQLGDELGPGVYLFGAEPAAMSTPFPELTAAVTEAVREARGAR
jgi:ribonuclease P protein component